MANKNTKIRRCLGFRNYRSLDFMMVVLVFVPFWSLSNGRFPLRLWEAKHAAWHYLGVWLEERCPNKPVPSSIGGARNLGLRVPREF